MAVSNWSTTADANTTVGGVSIAEHCPARNLNDAIRSVMAEAKARFDSDSFPGEVRLFYGTLDANGHPIPINSPAGTITGLSNWHVCDGTSGTPDMRGRVAVGVASGETLGAISGSDTVTPSITCNSATQSVSIGNTTLTASQLAQHNHGVRFVTRPGWWSITRSNESANKMGTDVTCQWYSGDTTDIATVYVGSNSTHTHTVTTSSHTHSLSVSSLNNRQASRALHYIMRLA